MPTDQAHSRRWIVILIVVAIVSTGAVISAFLGDAGLPSGQASASPAPVASAAASTPVAKPAVKTQRTLLLQVRDDSRRVIYSVLFATSYVSVSGARMPMPTNLLVPIPEWTALALTGDSVDTLQSQHALEELLGVDIDMSLVLDRLALTGLYDAALTPAAAEQAKASTDIDQWIYKSLINLPASPPDTGQLLLSLGHMARSSAPNAELVDLLLDLRKDARAKELVTVTLPTRLVRAGGAAMVIPDASEVVVRKNFALTLLTPGLATRPRVVLTPAGATAAQVAEATAALIDAGMTVIPGTPIARRTDSIVRIPDSSISLGIGRKVAAALGLFPQDMRQAKGYLVDAEVLLGLAPSTL
jgi:hypothetical protein